MEYDNNQRLQEMSAGPDTLTYYYHPLGGVERTAVYSSQSGAGESLDYGYYSTGLTSQRKIGSYAVDFQYDDVGNRTQITDPFNQTVNYQYDSLNRVDTITADNKQFSYEYYADGMIKAVDYPNGLRTEYTYDNINRLTQLTNKLGANVLSEFSYTYDKNSNIIAITSAGQTTTYQYDPLNRLTGIKRPSGEEINYQYDSRGNRSKGSITTIDTANFKAGEFAYNSWDELDSFTGSGSTAYSYDPEGLRTKKDTGTTVTRYFCDNNGLVVAESDGTGQVTAQNIWGHKALARNIDGNYYYYLYNGHGDVIQILDEAGNTVNSYSYDEWGNILSSQEQISNPMKYAGEYYDEETGLYYLRARYYDPSIGRFISKDRIEGDFSNPMGLNQYAYCVGNPIIYHDCNGFWAAQVHYDLTYEWAKSVGISDKYAREMAQGSKDIDFAASALPIIGNQAVHFDRNPDPNIDTRQQIFDETLAWAVEYSYRIEQDYQRKLDQAYGTPWFPMAKAIADYERERDIKNLCYQFGAGLHSIQDIAAHMDWAEGGWIVRPHVTLIPHIKFDDPQYDLVKLGYNMYSPVDSGEAFGSQRYKDSKKMTNQAGLPFLNSIVNSIISIITGG